MATEGGVERRLPEGLTLQLDFMPVQEWVCDEEMRCRQVYGEELKDRQEWVCNKELKSSQK